MSDLPHDAVAFLLATIENGARLWRESPLPMQEACSRYDALLQTVTASHGGVVCAVLGDESLATFPTAVAAVDAALQLQQNLAAEHWNDGGLSEPLAVRVAVHVDRRDPDQGDDSYAPVRRRLERLIAAGRGPAILLSATAQKEVRERIPEGSALRDLGELRLDDSGKPSRVFAILHPSLEQHFPPQRAAAPHQLNLPHPLTTFVGREREVAETAGLLQREDVRLLTLLGPGGCGKTRLSLHVARDLLPLFPDGVCFVELAAISDAYLVPSAIAAAMGVHEDGARPLRELIHEEFGPKRALLLLDNCEHVLTDTAAVAAEILKAAPGVKVLATSREPLHLPGEREIAVAPLALPPADRWHSPAELTQYEAVQLFVARVQEVQAAFAVDASNAAAVAEICARLDGLPLAIELAAARVKLLPPAALLRRLEQRLPLLTRVARNLPERQRTLQAAIAWSHDLLTSEEQALFRRLSIFAAGCTLEAAAAVADPRDELDIYERLTSLLDKSLIKSEDRAGEPRFSMLETIREFALQALQDSGEEAEIAGRHARIFRDLAERAEPALLSGNDAARWLTELDTEHENIRAALGWSLANDSATAVRLAGALSRFWMARGHLSEGRARLESAVAIASDHDPRAAAKVRDGAGRIAWVQGDFAQSVSLHEESLAYWRTTNDQVGIGWAETSLADAVAAEGDDARAIALYEVALQRFRAANDLQGISIVSNNLGVRAQNRGDLERAAALYEAALAIDYQLGDTTSIAVALGNLGDIALDQGRVADAAERFRSSLQLAWELRDVVISLQGLVGCGRVAVQMGDVRRGALVLAAAEAQSESLGTPLQPDERVGFDSAVAKIMSALGPGEGPRVWQAGREAEFVSVVLAEIAANRDQLSGGALAPSTVPERVQSRNLMLPDHVVISHPAVEFDLTRREREVVKLLARRLTDPEIAEHLFITTKTASHHVSSILGKLGAANRREAAAIAVQHSLV